MRTRKEIWGDLDKYSDTEQTTAMCMLEVLLDIREQGEQKKPGIFFMCDKCSHVIDIEALKEKESKKSLEQQDQEEIYSTYDYRDYDEFEKFKCPSCDKIHQI